MATASAFGFSGLDLGATLLERNWARKDAEQANAWSAESAQKAMDFSAAQAQKQMDFQQLMSNTSWQRGVEDMSKAGINPMLAFNQGGASSPTGAQGSSSSYTGAQPRDTKFGHMAANFGTAAQISNVEAGTRKTNAEAAILEDDVIERDSEYREGHKPPKTFSNRVKQMVGLTEWYKSKHEIEKIDLTKAEEKRVIQYIQNLITQNKLNTLDLPKAINEARAQESAYMRNVAPYTGELGKLVHSATEARRAFRPDFQQFRRK